ncbi:MAG: ATP synthase F1 subunit epsilon [Spirochaetaceae bacterium]|jgi:F-type H+-transporting ATPase subunit epsilon|nr:ATP synthase F1 subunit epsilon [Spirochaetaceae bacterium]
MAKLYPFEAHTPYRLFYADLIEALTLTLIDGEVGVYADHAPFTAPVCTGILRFKDKKGQWKQAFITEGILEVKPHKTVLLADAAEWPEEIDYSRAAEAKKRAEEQIASSSFRFEMETAKSNLRRAEFRLKTHALQKDGQT